MICTSRVILLPIMDMTPRRGLVEKMADEIKRFSRDFDASLFLILIMVLFAIFIVGLFLLEFFADKNDVESLVFLTPEVIYGLIILFTNAITSIGTFLYTKNNGKIQNGESELVDQEDKDRLGTYEKL